MAAHRRLGPGRVAVADRLEQLAVLVHRLLELGDAVEREEPDAQRQDVVLLERAREERAVGAGPDVSVDALVEVDQATVVAAGLVERLQQRDDGVAILVRARALPRAGPRTARARAAPPRDRPGRAR